MLSPLTPYAVAALLRAREGAARSGRPAANAEFLLVSLLHAGDGLASRVLLQAGIRPERVSLALALFVRPVGQPLERAVLADEVLHAVSLARHEARSLRDRRVGTEHLLLGLAGRGETKAAAVLLGLGAEPPRLRREIERLRPPGGGVTALARAAGDAPQVSLPEAGKVTDWRRRRLF